MNDVAHGPHEEPKAVSELPRVWGFWATLGWALGAFAFSFIVVIYGFSLGLWGRIDKPTEVHNDPGFPLQTIVICSAQIMIVIAAVREAGSPPGSYLGLDIPSRRDVLHGLAAYVAMLLTLELITSLLGRESVSPFMIDPSRTAIQAGTLPLLWLAIVVAAPLGEEILFRGFVFRGWAASPLGVPGTIALTSVIFAIFHIQYDWWEMFQVFCLGVLLGWLRWRSGSTTLAIGLHMVANIVATAWTALRIGGVV
jgi:membrane protease YdiL (CAAX protease family)